MASSSSAVPMSDDAPDRASSSYDISQTSTDGEWRPVSSLALRPDSTSQPEPVPALTLLIVLLPRPSRVREPPSVLEGKLMSVGTDSSDDVANGLDGPEPTPDETPGLGKM